MKTALALAALALAGCSNIKPLVVASHMSDPTMSSHHETTTDFIGVGAVATFGGVSIEGALGRKAHNCAAFLECPSTPGGLATIRWSPQ